MQLIEVCTNQLQEEIVGRAVYSANEDIKKCEGESLEISIIVDDLTKFLEEKECEEEDNR